MKVLLKNYKKKPIPIGAVKLTMNNFYDIVDLLTEKDCIGNYKYDGNTGKCFIEIKTLEGIMKLSGGNYLLRGIHGEFYPCDAAVFEESYEEA